MAEKRQRRRKVKRTEDFSSDSSLSESEGERAAQPVVAGASHVPAAAVDMDAMDVDLASDGEAAEAHAAEEVSDSTRRYLEQVPVTKTALAKVLHFGGVKHVDQEGVAAQLDEEREQLANQYLALMARTYDSDLDQLRQKPDFLAHAGDGTLLTMLAQVLKSGHELFDEKVLQGLVREA